MMLLGKEMMGWVVFMIYMVDHSIELSMSHGMAKRVPANLVKFDRDEELGKKHLKHALSSRCMVGM